MGLGSSKQQKQQQNPQAVYDVSNFESNTGDNGDDNNTGIFKGVFNRKKNNNNNNSNNNNNNSNNNNNNGNNSSSSASPYDSQYYNGSQQLPPSAIPIYTNTGGSGRSSKSAGSDDLLLPTEKFLSHNEIKKRARKDAGILALAATGTSVAADFIPTSVPGAGAGSATALNASIGMILTPFMGFITAGCLSYWAQAQRIKKMYKYEDAWVVQGDDEQLGLKKGDLTPAAKAFIKRNSIDEGVRLAMALFGAHLTTSLSTIVEHFEGQGFSEMLMKAMDLSGSAPWQVDVIMMVASGFGMALFLTATAAAQRRYHHERPMTKTEMAGMFITGLLAGMAAYISVRMMQVHPFGTPAWSNKLIAGLFTGLAVGVAFAAKPSIDHGCAVVAFAYERRKQKNGGEFDMDIQTSTVQQQTGQNGESWLSKHNPFKKKPATPVQMY